MPKTYIDLHGDYIDSAEGDIVHGYWVDETPRLVDFCLRYPALRIDGRGCLAYINEQGEPYYDGPPCGWSPQGTATHRRESASERIASERRAWRNAMFYASERRAVAAIESLSPADRVAVEAYYDVGW